MNWQFLRSSFTPTYQVSTSAEGRLIVDINGCRYASVLDQPYFVHEWFTGPEKEIIRGAEIIALESERNSRPRVYSALPAGSHIYANVETLFKNAQLAGVNLQMPEVAESLLHDRIENDSRVKQKYEHWEDAARSRNKALMKQYAFELDEIRREVASMIIRNLKGYIPRVREKEKKDLELIVEEIGTNVLRLTRFTDANNYPTSMKYQFSRYSCQRDGRIYYEPMRQTLRRPPEKFSDRIVNMKEKGPLPERDMEQHIMAFRDNSTMIDSIPLYQALRSIYGRIGEATNDEGPREMPASMQTQTAFNSMFPFHYFNETLNEWQLKIVIGRYGGRAKELHKLGLVTRDQTIDETVRLLTYAATSFEEKYRDIRAKRSRVKKEIAETDENFLRKITFDGFVKDLMQYDVYGREFIEALDKDPEKRELMYKAAEYLLVVIPRFKMFYDSREPGDVPSLLDNTQNFDPRVHKWFTMGNVDAALAMMPESWLKMSERNGSTKKAAKSRPFFFF